MQRSPVGPLDLDAHGLIPIVPRRGRRHPTLLLAVLAAVGLVLLAVVAAGALLDCRDLACSARPWWTVLVVGAALTVAGLAGWLRRPPADRAAGWQPVAVVVEVVVAAGAVLLVLPSAGRLQLTLLPVAGVAFVASALLAAAVAWWAGAFLHGRLAGGRRWHAAAVGGVAALSAGTAWGTVGHVSGDPLSLLPALPLLWAAALALTILDVRGVDRVSPLTGLAAVGLTGLALVSASSAGGGLLTAYLVPPPAEVNEPGPQALAPEPPPSTSTAVPSVSDDDPTIDVAGDLCTSSLLTTEVGTPVPGGHDVATTITVTNDAGQECRVEGWPTIRLVSDGEDLALFLHVANVDPGSGDHVEEDPVLLGPGESARTQVWWPANGAAADLETAQELRLGVGGTEVSVPLSRQTAWDVVRGSEAWVAPWQPADDPGDGTR